MWLLEANVDMQFVGISPDAFHTTDPLPGPRRLVKTPSRPTLSPWERAIPIKR